MESIKLGGPLFKKYDGPDAWIKIIKQNGYSAAYCPEIKNKKDLKEIRAYSAAAENSGIIIAEVGAWCNPLSADRKKRKEALEYCKTQLQLGENIGARCCVNIAGSFGEKWDGPCPEDLTKKAFDAIVETVRKVIDAVRPKKTFYALETMPWMYPDSPESYLKLIKSIGRKNFSVHLDPVNLINSPQKYFNNGALLKECFRKLGKYIKSCHAKDILLEAKLTTHLEEVIPGTGRLDYNIFMKELKKLNRDVPLMLEHLKTEKEYKQAAVYIRKIAGI